MVRARQRRRSAADHNIKSSDYKSPNGEPTTYSVNAAKRFRLITGNNLMDIPLIITTIIYFGYVFSPICKEELSGFIKLDHMVPGSVPIKYGKGYHDLFFILYCIFVITWTREVYVGYILRPFAENFTGIKSEAKIVRFVEQAYSLTYYFLSSLAGLYVMYKSPTWYFKTDQFWMDYPYKELSLHFKAYYLVQLSYWLQQIIVLIFGLERPRKDFNELVAHHIVTILLISLSYLYNWTRIGNAVFITMDGSDFFLSLAKLLNYSPNTQRASEFAFIWFIGVWIYLRHYIYVTRILFPVLFEMRNFIPVVWNPKEGIYASRSFEIVIVSLLIMLQFLCIFWLFLIFKILWRFVSGQRARDDREEDVEEDEDEDDVVEKDKTEETAKLPPDFLKNRPRSSSRLNIDHGDHTPCT